ncbi:hypothetical protein AB0950_39125 [Streptomyces sp. NPDC007189]|uniref:hypothetical protein n=1 Tax=Streptomyces sp. NPDC007189 TaxID=3154315 RepID=UPI00345475A1
MLSAWGVDGVSYCVDEVDAGLDELASGGDDFVVGLADADLEDSSADGRPRPQPPHQQAM